MTRPTTVVRDFQVEIDLDDSVYVCNVKGTSECTYAPGRTSGPPEDCCPDESEQETTFEILDCERDGERLFPGPELRAQLTPLLPVEWMEARLWDQYMREEL